MQEAWAYSDTSQGSFSLQSAHTELDVTPFNAPHAVSNILYPVRADKEVAHSSILQDGLFKHSLGGWGLRYSDKAQHSCGNQNTAVITLDIAKIIFQEMGLQFQEGEASKRTCCLKRLPRSFCRRAS